MSSDQQIKERIITAIDWYVIDKVRELRKSKFSQSQLSREIGLSDGFVGRVENPNHSAVYSLRHLNLIAKALKVNVTELLPEETLENDLIRLTIRWKSPTKIKKGEVNYEVINIEALTPEEIVEYNKKVLNRPTRSGVAPKAKKRRSTKKN